MRVIGSLAALALALIASPTSPLAQTGVAAPPSPQRVVARNVVLAHGAWVDGSSWSRVIPHLQAAGLHVATIASRASENASMR
jgi:alpha-beta hydrolase superfamily lysophospholipase